MAVEWPADVGYLRSDAKPAKNTAGKRAIYYKLVLRVQVRDQEEEVAFTYINHGQWRNVYRGWSDVLGRWLIWKIHPDEFVSNTKEAQIYRVGTFQMGGHLGQGSLQADVAVLSSDWRSATASLAS